MSPVSLDRRRRPHRRHAFGLLPVALAACDIANCIQIPCLPPTAVVAVVASATGSALTGLFVDVSGPAASRITCEAATGRCVVPGGAGTYTLTFGATGYQPVQRTVTVIVVRATQSCACDTVTTQQLQLTLVPL